MPKIILFYYFKMVSFSLNNHMLRMNPSCTNSLGVKALYSILRYSMNVLETMTSLFFLLIVVVVHTSSGHLPSQLIDVIGLGLRSVEVEAIGKDLVRSLT
jgi:hypothetical protein